MRITSHNAEGILLIQYNNLCIGYSFHNILSYVCVHAFGLFTVVTIFVHSASSDICAALALDNNKVGHTDWKAPSNHAWDQVFSMSLDKVSGHVALT